VAQGNKEKEEPCKDWRGEDVAGDVREERRRRKSSTA
jgi:hypothetical protein